MCECVEKKRKVITMDDHEKGLSGLHPQPERED